MEALFKLVDSCSLAGLKFTKSHVSVFGISHVEFFGGESLGAGPPVWGQVMVNNSGRKCWEAANDARALFPLYALKKKGYVGFLYPMLSKGSKSDRYVFFLGTLFLYYANLKRAIESGFKVR